MHNTSLSGAASFAFSFIFDLVFLWLLSFLFFIYFWLSKCLVGSCIFIVDLFKLVLLFVSIYICVECGGDTCSTTGKLAAAAGNSSRNSFGRVIQHFISSFWAKGTKSSRGNSQKQSYAKTAESRTAPTLSLSLSHWSSLSYISTTTVGATAKVCVCVGTRVYLEKENGGQLVLTPATVRRATVATCYHLVTDWTTLLFLFFISGLATIISLSFPAS